MGMTPAEYWDGESGLKKAYREAWKLRMEHEERVRDRQAWLQAGYIRIALNSMALMVNGFVPKGVHPDHYPEKPLLEKAEEEKKEADKRRKEENQRKLAMAMMQAAVARINKNILNKQKKQKAKAGE